VEISCKPTNLISFSHPKAHPKASKIHIQIQVQNRKGIQIAKMGASHSSTHKPYAVRTRPSMRTSYISIITSKSSKSSHSNSNSTSSSRNSSASNSPTLGHELSSRGSSRDGSSLGTGDRSVENLGRNGVGGGNEGKPIRIGYPYYEEVAREVEKDKGRGKGKGRRRGFRESFSRGSL
jgi:hypothetical protein